MDCWSLCENSLGGNGTLLALYCASVVGTISGPTFNTTPMRPASNRLFSPESCGASPICAPDGKGVRGVRPNNWSRGVARLPRMVAYAAWLVGSKGTTVLLWSFAPYMNTHTKAL